MNADVQRLLDERAIREVLLRYCRGVDRLELDLVRECYHSDAIDDHGSFRGGVDAYLAWIGRLLPRYEVTMHLLGNVLVEFSADRPEVARVETYGVAIHQQARWRTRAEPHDRISLPRPLRAPGARRLANC